MTLKEKFDRISYEYREEDVTLQCEKEAEDFAISFAIWMYDYEGNINRIRELLEIYKKEKKEL